MDQRGELQDLNYLLELVNASSSIYNFSQSTALEVIHDYLHRMYTLDRPSTVALICLYIPVFLFSLGGNALVILVVIKNAHMRRAKNLFLVNLAVADLCVTVFCMPLVVGQIVFRLWVYGEFMCKLTGYMQGISVSASIFTLTALSVDRYLAIKGPMAASTRRVIGKKQTVACLTAIWATAGIFVGPVLFVRKVYAVNFDIFNINVQYCVEHWPGNSSRKAYSTFLMIATYVIPIFVVTICYSLIGKALCSSEFHRRTSESSATVMLGRKRVARMLIVLIGVFLVCWLPYNICSLSLDLKLNFRDTLVLPFTVWFGHAHSAINPILYWFLNRNFRHCMRKVLRCHFVRPSFSKPSPSPQSLDDVRNYLQVGISPHDKSSPLNPSPRPFSGRYHLPLQDHQQHPQKNRVVRIMYHQPQPGDFTHQQQHRIAKPGYDSDSSMSSLESSPDSSNYLKNLVAFAAPSGVNTVAVPQHITRDIYVHTEVGQSCGTTTTTMTTGGTTSATDLPDTSSGSSNGTSPIGAIRGAPPTGGLRVPQYFRAASYESFIPSLKTLPKQIHKSLDNFFKSSSNDNLTRSILEHSNPNSPKEQYTSPKTIHKSLDNFFSSDNYSPNHQPDEKCNSGSDQTNKVNHPENFIDMRFSQLGQSEPLLDYSISQQVVPESRDLFDAVIHVVKPASTCIDDSVFNESLSSMNGSSVHKSISSVNSSIWQGFASSSNSSIATSIKLCNQISDGCGST